ncbi:hypothetical protein V8E54_012080 [Elaphomyces granulatus]
MSATGADSPSRTGKPASEIAPIDCMAVVQNARKAEQYTNDTKKPNFHTALHYSAMADEYSIPSNSQVLIGEDKHRYYKMKIFHTNFQNAERDLLFAENLRQVVRLILANAFRGPYPELTTVLQDIAATYEDEDESLVVQDVGHKNLSVIGCIQAKYCHKTFKLLTLSNNVPDYFRRALSSAYGSYDMPDIVRFRNSSFQWCKKFTFTSPDEERRYTFKLGDYINVKQEAQPTQGLQDIVRIDQIFIHKWDKEQRLFIIRRIPRQPEDAPFIIGLPMALPRKLYIVPIADDSDADRFAPHQMLKLGGPDDKELLWMERSLQWL